MEPAPGDTYVVIHPHSTTNPTPKYLVTLFRAWANVANGVQAGYTSEAFDTFAEAHEACRTYNVGFPSVGVIGGVHVCNDVCAGKVPVTEGGGIHIYLGRRVDVHRRYREGYTEWATVTFHDDGTNSRRYEVPNADVALIKWKGTD